MGPEEPLAAGRPFWDGGPTQHEGSWVGLRRRKGPGEGSRSIRPGWGSLEWKRQAGRQSAAEAPWLSLWASPGTVWPWLPAAGLACSGRFLLEWAAFKNA